MDPIAVAGAAAREQPPQSAQRGAAAERAHVRAAAGRSLATSSSLTTWTRFCTGTIRQLRTGSKLAPDQFAPPPVNG
jgi:hypothetical protein